MDDCISRQQAIDIVRNRVKRFTTACVLAVTEIEKLPSAQPERPEQPESAKEYCAECNHIEMCRWYPYEGCEFRSLPSAQPERKNGKWIDGRCSICGCDIPAYIIDWKWQKDMNANYCPSCGADMRGESDE